MNQEASLKTRGQERGLWMREDNGVCVLDVYVAPPDHQEKEEGFSQAGNSLASSPVRPLQQANSERCKCRAGAVWVS